ncbi:hypothetical protein [Aliikangiella sp. G2MR2-5]|uniref:hypothetical protein n=1 Tax=Aliikangiella sp. G2MR2-5 TaxID=2788943 RepID=UPI0018A8D2B1|nr:hypothetical protein [Aliikangiella sp. G2MR2-5]
MDANQAEELDRLVQVKVDKDRGFAEITFEGGITRKHLDHSFSLLINDPDFKKNMNALYDYSRAYSDLEMPEIEEHAQFVVEHLNLRGTNYKLALVASDTLNIALLEVYKLLISKTSVEAEVFHNIAAARRWLMEKH